jgi:hypothetical protein
LSGYGNNPKGGFGAYLLLAHNWANPQATLRSYELIAREVMPQFQGHAQATLGAARRAKEAREGLAAAQSKAVEDARVRYQAELTKRGQVALSGSKGRPATSDYGGPGRVDRPLVPSVTAITADLLLVAPARWVSHAANRLFLKIVAALPD